MSLEEYSLWEYYHSFKSSIFQEIFWAIWPTLFSMKYHKYKNIKKEDILISPIFQDLRNKKEMIGAIKKELGRIK